MTRTVVREHHWSPTTVLDLYIDDADMLGLEFWDNDVRETYKRNKKK